VPEASTTIVIERPVEEVFAFLADAENDKRWRQGVIEITKAGGQGVGTAYRQVVSGPGGRRIDADIEITEFVPDQRIAFRTTAGPVRPTGSYDLRAVDGGTELSFALDVHLNGFKKLMTPMVSRTLRSELGGLAELKRVLEKVET
jgi:uncharacterized protein YndB with AHSA1/START domain